MLAAIEKSDNGYIARFERPLKHSIEHVWSMLTDNEKLRKWFSELKVEDLRKGGLITFDMQNGTFEKMVITDLEIYSVLEYTWAEDLVRFELYPNSDGCLLVLNEKIKRITEHTPRDLAGWHVCLDVIHALLDGRTMKSRKEEWKKSYEKYADAIAKIQK